MSEKKCFCHLNGYEVKDKQARDDLAKLSESVAKKIDKVEGTMDYETVVTRAVDGNYYLTPSTYRHIDKVSVMKRDENGTSRVVTLDDDNAEAKATDIVNRQYVQGKLANAGGGGKLYEYTVSCGLTGRDNQDYETSIQFSFLTSVFMGEVWANVDMEEIRNIFGAKYFPIIDVATASITYGGFIDSNTLYMGTYYWIIESGVISNVREV